MTSRKQLPQIRMGPKQNLVGGWVGGWVGGLVGEL